MKIQAILLALTIGAIVVSAAPITEEIPEGEVQKREDEFMKNYHFTLKREDGPSGTNERATKHRLEEPEDVSCTDLPRGCVGYGGKQLN
ncbi:hypothetical protein BGZ46_006339 [Entomortierella lignicola]|nr:hypothetical protein BGZ46_006339 [Entomortierella lignicola]